MADDRPLVLITGVAGEVGEAVVGALGDGWTVVGLDRKGKSASVPIVPVDLTDDESTAHAIATVRERYGDHVASVVHLAGYYDFTGRDDPLYRTLNVEGTRRLLRALGGLAVEQLIYAGTMLVHAAVGPDGRFDEERRLDPGWIYPRSKAEAEAVIREERGDAKVVLFHLAGLYSDKTVVPTLAHQIARIRERDLESRVYPGNLRTRQAMVHHSDMADAFRRAVERRADLPGEVAILVGEPDPARYLDLQDRVGELIHGTDWPTVRVPALAAKAGAWAQDVVLPHLPSSLGGGRKPFVRPFMMDQASDSYAFSIERARTLLGWEPRHRLWDELPAIVAGLTRDPKGWYEANKVDWRPGDA